MNIKDLFARRDAIMESAGFVNYEEIYVDDIMESYEILEEGFLGTIKDIAGNVIKAIINFFSRLIERVKAFFSKSKDKKPTADELEVVDAVLSGNESKIKTVVEKNIKSTPTPTAKPEPAAETKPSGGESAVKTKNPSEKKAQQQQQLMKRMMAIGNHDVENTIVKPIESIGPKVNDVYKGIENWCKAMVQDHSLDPNDITYAALIKKSVPGSDLEKWMTGLFYENPGTKIKVKNINRDVFKQYINDDGGKIVEMLKKLEANAVKMIQNIQKPFATVTDSNRNVAVKFNKATSAAQSLITQISNGVIQSYNNVRGDAKYIYLSIIRPYWSMRDQMKNKQTKPAK